MPGKVTKRSQKAAKSMLYAVLWDMVGGPREFNANNTFDPNFELFPKREFEGLSVFTDDSILTTAIARTLRQSHGKADDELFKNTIVNLKEFTKNYPNGTFPGGYGPRFVRWAREEGTEPMKSQSCGNGSAMRVSPVGWAYNTLEQTLKVAALTAEPSHSDPEGIKGAQAIAAAVYLARAGVEQDDIRNYLETKFDYDLDTTLADYQKYNRDELKFQSEVCPTTVPMAICAFLKGKSFEECGRNAITLGGDSDTIGAMAGGIAGAFFGMPRWLEEECDKRLDDTLRKEAKDFQDYIDSIDTEPRRDELDNALARARLEHHILEQYKAGKESTNDPEYLDLMAAMEATRLFYDEVNKARQNGDELSEQALTYSKDVLVAQLKEKLKTSPELLEEYGKMETWPIKMVKVIDYDKDKRRETDEPSLIPAQRPQVMHELIPEKIVTDSSIVSDFFAKGIENAKAELDKKAQVTAQVGIVMAQKESAEYDDGSVRLEEFYDAVIDNMIGENGEINEYFSSGNKPKLLTDALDYLNNMKEKSERTAKWDPVKLSENALKKLNTLSDELIRTVNSQNSEEVVNQIAFVNRLANAVDAWLDAPTELAKALENPSDNLRNAKRTRFGKEINSDEMQAVKDRVNEIQDIYSDKSLDKAARNKKVIESLINLKLESKQYLNTRTNHNERYKAVQKIDEVTQKQLNSYDQLDILVALSDTLDNKKRTILGNEVNSDEMLKVKECLSALKETIKNDSLTDQQKKFMYDVQLNKLEECAGKYVKSHSTHNDRYELVSAIRKAAQNQLERMNPAYRAEKTNAKVQAKAPVTKDGPVK